MRKRSLEQAVLEHARAELEYRRSPQAKLDAQQDAQRRANADKTAGHDPKCSLTKCHPSCPSVTPVTDMRKQDG